ncbi:MAG: NADP(H)-dependent aldo-keto reductase [Alphaproteobacteria bacterium]|nr:NADP(H)-dependent aldo-keto reductase [Alphaproteobacteria bacterium SS10]
MRYSPLGRTDIQVSRICLGTMTWGVQNTEAEGHEQMDYAVDQGVNFFDTAEMYSVPPSAETYGKTEEFIGNWFTARKNRDKIVLATKVVGRAPHFDWIRDGKTRSDKANIVEALENSLKRLQTDYVDLYQLHWPDRPANRFGQLGFNHDPEAEEAANAVPILETLEVLGELVKAGKICTIGLSNDTPYGLMKFLHYAETLGLPRVVSVQNPYNLLNRSYEVGLAEISIREDCGCLPYSPLAGGQLSGKYIGGARPPGARRSMDSRKSRYGNPQAEAATEDYVGLAEMHGLDPNQMAIAFCDAQPFVTSTIIGATSMEQLRINIAAKDVTLSEPVMAGIEAIHQRHPNPGP